MANLSLSGFKKLKEDKKTVTMGHPNGHEITILKSKIPSLQRKQLDSLPIHLLHGGDTETDSDSSAPAGAPTLADVQSAPPVSADVSKAIAGPSAVQAPPVASDSVAPADDHQSYASDSPLTPRQMVVNADQQSASASPDSAPVTAPANAKHADPIGGVNVQGAYAQGQKAIDEQSAVAAQLAQKQADVQQNDIDARKELQVNAQRNAKDFQEHQKAILNDYMNNHINPNHFQENMGTGQKVATAIGLLLGGFTGGFNGTGVNPAAEWLNGQITRDIEAQKSRMEQQKTLLGANQELYRDGLLADNATRISLNDIYDHQIQQQANLLGTPAAKAAADAQHSKFALDNATLLQQNATRSAALQAIKRGGAGLDPITLGQAQFMSAEDAKKEQESVNKQRASISEINKLYGEASKLGLEAKIPYSEAASHLATINSQISDIQLRSDKVSRLSPEVQKQFIAPSLIDIGDLARGAKNQGPLAIKQNALMSKLQAAYAGETPITSRIAPGAVPNWGAISQPNTKTVNGITYARGPNGEAVRVK